MRNSDVSGIILFCEVTLDKRGFDKWGNSYPAGKKLFTYTTEWYEFDSVEQYQKLKSAPDYIVADSKDTAMASLEEMYPNARWGRNIGV